MIHYIVYKFGKLWTSNAGDYMVRNLRFETIPQNLAYPTEYLSNYSTDLYQTVSVGGIKHGDY